MTEAELSQYRSIKHEIEDLDYKIKDHMKELDQLTFDKVKGSSKEYPYIEKNFNICGVDEEVNKRVSIQIAELTRKRENKKAELLETENNITDFIFAIPDSETRRIFTMMYITGDKKPTQEHIAKKFHMDQCTISKRLSKYIKIQSCY